MSDGSPPEPVQIERIGARIKRLRMAKGVSQDRLAIEAHVDQSGLSKFERGKDRRISRAALERIAAVLKVPLEDLIAGTGQSLG